MVRGFRNCAMLLEGLLLLLGLFFGERTHCQGGWPNYCGIDPFITSKHLVAVEDIDLSHLIKKSGEER